MSYIENLEQKGVSVPTCYKEFRANEDFESNNDMIYSGLDKEVYSETTALQFDWDEYMLEELFDPDNPEYIPIAIFHGTDIIEDAYLAIPSDSESCAVYLFEVDEESEDLEVIEIADNLESFLDALSDPEDNYIQYLEKRFNTSIPQRYKNFMLSYEYLNYNGEIKYNDEEIFFDEFPNLQWAAENYNKDNLQWIPLAAVGEDHNEYGDSLAIKVGEEDCPVYILNGEEQEQLTKTLTEFLG